MRQALLLDRRSGFPYHGLVVVAALAAGSGCVPGLTSIAPANLVPIAPDSVSQWARAFQPAVALKYELRWRFENFQGASAGRAAVRFAPPDTLRFDYRGPFGRSGSAVIVGDSALWAEPEGDFRSLVPVAPMLWAALGIAVPAAEGASLLGREDDGRRAWRYVEADEAIDFIYEREPVPRLLSELRRGGRIAGIVTVDLAGATRQPKQAVMQFPTGRATLTFTVQGVDTVAAFSPDTWQRS
jgi:hypothetical protein